MTRYCPNCGADLTANGTANPNAIPPQIEPQIGAQAQIAQGFEVQEPATNKGKTYNQGYDQQFLSFWKIYPAKRDKRKAQIAWKAAVKRLTQTGVSKRDAIATIAAGAERYRDDPNRDPFYTKYAEGWLNGDRWDDEPLPFRLRPGEMPAAPRVERLDKPAPPTPEEQEASREAALAMFAARKGTA